MFGEIENLVRKIDYSSMKAEHSIKKVGSSGNVVRQAAFSNEGAGGVNFAANIENQRRFKKGSINAFQNAISIMQAQSDAIRQADKIYNQMRTLANQAADPLMNDRDRSLLSDQFNDLRERALSIAATKFNKKLIFDPLAASTKYEVSFGQGQLKVLSNNAAITRFEEADVLYNKGKMTIDVNGGSSPEQFTLWQGNEKIFDTGLWKTRSNARNWDYDRFIVEFGPEQQTTFQFVPLSPGDSQSKDSILDAPGYPGNLTDNNQFDNKQTYLQQLLGTTTDENGKTPSDADYYNTSGWSSRDGAKYTQLGQVTTYTVNSDSSILRLQVYSPGTIFQVKGSFELPELEDEFVGREDDLQVRIQKLGLGLLRENDQAGGFPEISIDTFENAGKAIASLSNEIEGVGEQLGRLANNFNRVQNAIEATQEMVNVSESVLSSIGGDGLTQDLLNLSKARINRAQDTALLSQAMSIHQDLVNVLI